MAYPDRTDLARHGVSAILLEEIPTTDQDEALQTASDEADDYLRERFTLPLTTWSRSLRKHVAVMAAYELQVVRHFNVDSSDKELRRRYDDAIAWLKSCSLGQLTLAHTADATPQDDGDNGMTFAVSNPGRGWRR